LPYYIGNGVYEEDFLDVYGRHIQSNYTDIGGILLEVRIYDPTTGIMIERDWHTFDGFHNYLTEINNYNKNTGIISQVRLFATTGYMTANWYYDSMGNITQLYSYDANTGLETQFIQYAPTRTGTAVTEITYFGPSGNKTISYVYNPFTGKLAGIKWFDVTTGALAETFAYDPTGTIVTEVDLYTNGNKVEADKFNELTGKITEKDYFNASTGLITIAHKFDSTGKIKKE